MIRSDRSLLQTRKVRQPHRHTRSNFEDLIIEERQWTLRRRASASPPVQSASERPSESALASSSFAWLPSREYLIEVMELEPSKVELVLRALQIPKNMERFRTIYESTFKDEAEILYELISSAPVPSAASATAASSNRTIEKTHFN